LNPIFDKLPSTQKRSISKLYIFAETLNNIEKVP